VAANAVESASRLEPDLAIALIEPKTSSRHNRIRANAILGLLRQGAPDAAGQLHAMLSDPEPLQRVSAIWVATRSRAVDEIRTLRRLAGEDRVPELRTRAAAAARLLDAQAVHRPTERMACS
jgi:HEAT repeat protein